MPDTELTHIPSQLADLVCPQLDGEAIPGMTALVDAVRAQHGDAALAVLFYGSCLRSGNLYDGLADLYLLVDDYRSAFASRTLAVFNKLLPPNVFYIEIPFNGQMLRAKYAILTLDDFRRGTESWFHSYVWGRFAQKTRLIYTKNEAVAEQAKDALAAAVKTFFLRTIPQMEQAFTARQLWAKGLKLSYRSELRTEQADQAVRLFDDDPDYYQALTDMTMTNLSLDVKIINDDVPSRYRAELSRASRTVNKVGWVTRAVQGKLLSVLRLLKGFFTFKGGVDYIQWKIERHSGVRVDVSPKVKKFPPLALMVIVWRLYRKNAFR